MIRSRWDFLQNNKKSLVPDFCLAAEFNLSRKHKGMTDTIQEKA